MKKVYWDAAKTKSSTIIWYPVPDGTPFLPFRNRFTAEIWDPIHWYDDGAGEDDATGRTYYNGAALGPFKGGGHFCGEPPWFEHGSPSDAPPLPRTPDGLPACCFGRGAYSSAFSIGFDVLRALKE